MSKLASILRDKDIVFFQADRMSLDPYFYEPFQDTDERFDTSVIFETDNSDTIRKVDVYDHSFFQYFLDGSRKTYKIGDIITKDNKFVPVVTGQLGAVCCHRNSQHKMEKYKSSLKYVLMLYDSINEHDFDIIKKTFEGVHHKGVQIEVHEYSINKMKDEAPTNAAIAKIHKMMADEEVEMLRSMVSENVLDTNRMLAIDGSLQFLTQKYNPEIFYNVVGISKSFNPNLTGVLKGKKHIGVLLSKLQFGQRTPVYKYENKKNTIGAWYLRIRERQNVKNPLEGVVKLEKMALKENIDNDGFDTGLINNISSSILAERIPTCHGRDSRWANHLYPIYLTERYLKSSFLSDKHYINLF